MKRFAALILFAAPLLAQQPADDPLARYLVPPDLIMGHSQELNLQDKQRAAIKSEVQKAQSKFIDMQWDMKEKTEKMVRLLQQTPADETRILEQAEKGDQTIGAVCRTNGIAENTFYRWRKTYGGMSVNERLRKLIDCVFLHLIKAPCVRTILQAGSAPLH